MARIIEFYLKTECSQREKDRVDFLVRLAQKENPHSAHGPKLTKACKEIKDLIANAYRKGIKDGANWYRLRDEVGG